MANNQQLQFLQEKIREIGSAIFYNQSDSVLKLPTSIVSTLKVDEYGYVWFYVQKPKQTLQEFEMDFPARLDFFKKGVNCFLQVSGKGWVVNDPEEINAYVALPGEVTADDSMVLVKVKILKAEYYETSGRTRSNWWQSAFGSMTTWFRTSNHYNRPNTYYPVS